MPLQASLVRYFEEKRVTRIGARDAVTVDTRMMAATDQDLKQAVAEGKFRDDLYFGFVAIPIPPLRDSPEDILLLANVFLKKFADENGKKVTGFYATTVDAMMAYSWPGNVRELENRVKRAVVMAEGSRISSEDLELSPPQSKLQRPGRTLKEAREALEREMITDALGRCRGNITRAAEELGVSRPTLYELMVKLGMPRL